MCIQPYPFTDDHADNYMDIMWHWYAVPGITFRRAHAYEGQTHDK
jgi:hypothetical protein